MDDMIPMKKSTKSYKIRRQIKLPWMRLRLSPFKKVHCVQAWISSAFSRFLRIMGWGVESMSSKLANRLQRISRDLLVLEPFNHDPLDLWKSNAVSLWLLKSTAFSCKKRQQKEPSPSAVATLWCEVAKRKRPSGQQVSLSHFWRISHDLWTPFWGKDPKLQLPRPNFLASFPTYIISTWRYLGVCVMIGNLGGTNEANFSKTPSYSLSISRGSFSIGFSWSILSICVGMKSWWPSEAVMDEHKTLRMVFKLLFKGTLQKCMGVRFKSGEMYRNVVPISEAKQVILLQISHLQFSPFLPRTAGSTYAIHPKFPWTLKTPVKLGFLDPGVGSKNPTIFKAQKLLKRRHCQSEDVQSQARYHIATNHIWDLRGGASDTCINWTP